jgi:hypothetical protein
MHGTNKKLLDYTVGLILFDLQLPEDGTPVPKHTGVSIIVMNFILLSAFVSGCIKRNAALDMELRRSKLQVNYSFTTIKTQIRRYVPVALPVLITIFHEN